VQTSDVVVVHEIGNDSSGLLKRQRSHLPDTITFYRLVIAFQLAVALRIVRRGFDMFISFL
jgi:hypothetical protein